MTRHAPAILLDRPQMGENIGSVARVMANFGLYDLRLIAPRDGWPNPAALPISAGAFDAGVRARVFDTYAGASADLHGVLAATARTRSLSQPVHDCGGAVLRLAEIPAQTGIVFGPENSGLSNEIVALAAGIVRLSASQDFSSLNLAHAVAIFCHEWAVQGARAGKGLADVPEPASQQECLAMIAHLEQELERCGWFYPEHKRSSMQLNLRSAFVRAGWSSQEVRAFRGIISALAGRADKTGGAGG